MHVLILCGISVALLALWALCPRAISVVDSNTIGLGRWTANQLQPLGTIYKAPALGSQAQKTYMYVQFVSTGSVDVYDGTPVGFGATTTNGSFYVHGDQSAVLGVAQHGPAGIIRKSDSTAVTDEYYGWIQLAQKGEVLDSCAVKTAAAAADRVKWASDTILETTAAFDSTEDVIPFGVVLTPAVLGAAPGTTANQLSNVLVL